MRKGLIVLLAAVLVAAFTLPAMADSSAHGFIRTKAWMSNFMSNTAGSFTPTVDAPTNSFVETRARVLFKTGTEDAQFVYYGEFDQEWGGQAYATGRNQGGGLEADTTNLETKNIYVMFKVPNTSWNFKVGVQNQTDAYAGVIFGVADMAGVFVTGKFDPVSLRLGWAKFWENGNATADDIDLYIAEAKFAPMPDVELGLNFYFLNDMGAGTKGNANAQAFLPLEVTTYDNLRLYIPGFDFSAKAGPAKISGFFFYETGTYEVPAGTDVDVSGFAGDLRADMNLGPGKFFVEGIYVSGDDNQTDTDYKSIITASNYNLAGSYFYRMDAQFLGAGADDINTSQSLVYEMSNSGAGIWMLSAGYSQKLTDKVSGKVGLAYASAVDKRAREYGGAANFLNDSSMAVELNGHVNYMISKGLDIGVYGAYAFLGSAYDVTSGSDRDDPYMLYARLNFGF
jgi:hypothetical protein